MTHLYVSVAIGTAATLTALTLLLLRISVHSSHTALTLVRRWIVTSQSISLAVLAPLTAIAAFSFANVAVPHLTTNGLSFMANSIAITPAASADGQAWESLRAYVAKLNDDRRSDTTKANSADVVELPAVDVMVAKLIVRLQEQPNDVSGWKMLGWSYLNTGRPAEATEAYQTALKLEPGNAEVEKALKAAQSAHSSQSAQSDSATETAEPNEQDAMVRGMVDRLAAKLETSPNDEVGWLQLIRSRMVLGEKDAAIAGFSKALAAFATDPAVKERLIVAARALGIERSANP